MTDSLLSPRDLARAIGVSESSIKRWVDEGLIKAARTAGRHRRIPFAEAVRYIRESRSIVVDPGPLGLKELEAVRDVVTTSGEDTRRLYDFLAAGAALETRGLLIALYLGGQSLAEIADGPVRLAFERLGGLWLEEEKRGIFAEHRATEIAIRALNQLVLMLPPPPEDVVAVGGAPPRDPYLLPTFLASAALVEVGYKAVNLGPETPLRVFGEAVVRLEPHLVWLSLSGEDPLLEAAELDRLLEDLDRRGASLVVGGRRTDVFTSGNGHVRTGASMAELQALAREAAP